ncbi:polysaccharide deacetylase [Dyadobacter jejuensis]|uniref:Polysaccharide deacetylase n=1 Tax=Dyadobacter jejuensis TaxID=1082580 RepID=A0A316AQW2_9BACT|nr:polysaccharide deacetylase family protein [Dyadobacter jejuensis]PWJ60123.1 polysaccharide deacetylase [Dyadobacter jejuensis]
MKDFGITLTVLSYRLRKLTGWHLSLGLLLLLGGCVTSTNDPSKGGVAISFDDHFIEDWYALKPMLDRYGAKVTFFVTCPDSLTPREVLLLKSLEADGHEIGFHGTIHGRSTDLIATQGPEGYKDIELSPGLGYMLAAGFTPTSYAHPGGNHNERVDSVLLAEGFRIQRDVAIARRTMFGVPLYRIAPKIMPWIYNPFDGESQVDALLIDTDGGLSVKDMEEAVGKAKATGTALMLFGHQPLSGPPVGGQYGFDIAFLEAILQRSQEAGLRYYRMSDLVAP